MVKSLREALTRALTEKGEEVPQLSGRTQQREHDGKTLPKPDSAITKFKDASNRVSTVVRSSPNPGKNRQRPKVAAVKARTIRALQQDIANLASVYGASNPQASNRGGGQVSGSASSAAWTIKIGRTPKVNEFLKLNSHQLSILSPRLSGISDQAPGANERSDVRELAIGLDFGTSSVKVIVGDHAAGVAFAVPFFEMEGIEGYLLPSRLYETAGHFSLKSGAKIHRNLKLSLFASGDTAQSQRRATAFLALVVRHARAWLLSEHSEIYGSTKILWKLVLGMPAENYADTRLVDRFQQLARSAWILAGMRHKDITADMADLATVRGEKAGQENPALSGSSDVEIDVVPELSAQIFGFLQSNRFDRNAKNIFVMVDVGAGTVDSALFHVKREKAKWNFEFFTNLVQPLGVMNLHRERVDWWLRALEAHPENPRNLVEALREMEMSTDHMGSIPEQLEGYVTDVAVTFSDRKKHPDEEFFVKKVVAQVRGKTIWRTWKDGYLSQGTLAGVPLFLCGGGMRMNYFNRLAVELKNFPGCTWLSARPMGLEIPKDLEAPGLVRDDYDRLSVAYGLSFLNVGKIVKALPPPVAPTPQQQSWHFTDRFIDKDQV